MGLFDWFKRKLTPPVVEEARVTQTESHDHPRFKPPKVAHSDSPKAGELIETPKKEVYLSEAQQLVVCELLGRFKTPREVAAYMKREHDVSIHPESIYHYLRNEKWKALIGRHRQEFLAEVDLVPIRHKRVRLERLEDIYQQAQDEPAHTDRRRQEKRKEALEVLKQARAEEESFAPGTMNVVAINLANLSDEELQAKIDALREKVTKLGRRLTNGRSSDTRPQTIETTAVGAPERGDAQGGVAPVEGSQEGRGKEVTDAPH